MEKELTTEVRTCPLCGKSYTGHPALSRLDNETLICPDCYPRNIVIQENLLDRSLFLAF